MLWSKYGLEVKNTCFLKPTKTHVFITVLKNFKHKNEFLAYENLKKHVFSKFFKT